MELEITDLSGGKVRRLKPAEILIGRDPDATISIDDAGVSRHHLKLWAVNGTWQVCDLGSTNGTTLNGRRLGTYPAALTNGAELRFGSQHWRCSLASAVDSARVLPPVAVPPVVRPRGDGVGSCRQCGANVPFLQRAALQESGGICRTCREREFALHEQFRRTFLGLIHSRPLLTETEMKEIRDLVTRLGVDARAALAPLARERLAALQRQLTIAKHDGVIDPAEISTLRKLQSTLFLTDAETSGVWAEVNRLNTLHGIQSGNLQPVASGLAFGATEICYHEVPATYHKQLTNHVREIPGVLSMTDAKVRFVASSSGHDTPWSKVAAIKPAYGSRVHLALTKQSGAGYYLVGDPDITAALGNALLDRHHRRSHVIAAGSRSISADVKAQVFARDGGRCNECGDAQYLEFDHIIPFSKGGATSVNNLQLLCRACNMKKGARL